MSVTVMVTEKLTELGVIAGDVGTSRPDQKVKPSESSLEINTVSLQT